MKKKIGRDRWVAMLGVGTESSIRLVPAKQNGQVEICLAPQ